MQADPLASQSSPPENYREVIWTTGGTPWHMVALSGHKQFNALGEQLEIRRVFTPAAMTGLYQPLDRRICGSLKADARAGFDRCATNAGDGRAIMHSFAILLSAWRSIGDEEMLQARAPFTSVNCSPDNFPTLSRGSRGTRARMDLGELRHCGICMADVCRIIPGLERIRVLQSRHNARQSSHSPV
jgi:hypothetical protein